MSDPFAIDWEYARSNLATADYTWSVFDSGGSCYISVEQPMLYEYEGQEYWHLGRIAAGTFITIDMTNLDWRNSLRRRP